MITQDELEMFVDGFIQPPVCVSDDACPIDFGQKGDNENE